MDSYSNKINQIKHVIDEIREDIENMKKVNLIYNLINNFIDKGKE